MSRDSREVQCAPSHVVSSNLVMLQSYRWCTDWIDPWSKRYHLSSLRIMETFSAWTTNAMWWRHQVLKDLPGWSDGWSGQCPRRCSRYKWGDSSHRDRTRLEAAHTRSLSSCGHQTSCRLIEEDLRHIWEEEDAEIRLKIMIRSTSEWS